MNFPAGGTWYLVPHDELVDLVGQTTNWLNPTSWRKHGGYSSASPSPALLGELRPFALDPTLDPADDTATESNETPPPTRKNEDARPVTPLAVILGPDAGGTRTWAMRPKPWKGQDTNARLRLPDWKKLTSWPAARMTPPTSASGARSVSTSASNELGRTSKLFSQTRTGFGTWDHTTSWWTSSGAPPHGWTHTPGGWWVGTVPPPHHAGCATRSGISPSGWGRNLRWNGAGSRPKRAGWPQNTQV